jgi:hypothetical protein
VVLLLHAYDKGQDTSKKRQQNEIEVARKRKTIVDERAARERKAQRRGQRQGT